MKALDIGASPGGWSQVIAKRTDSEPGKESVVAVDLIKMNEVPGVKFVQGDIEKDEV